MQCLAANPSARLNDSAGGLGSRCARVLIFAAKSSVDDKVVSYGTYHFMSTTNRSIVLQYATYTMKDGSL
ncbi:hypothetical protein ACHAXS_009550 [Conticribra weissflogii]